MDLLDRLREFLGAQAAPTYFVGGTLRDRLLGRPIHDIDITVQGRAAPLARAFADANHAAFYVMDEEFDVARVILDGQETVDFARLRGAFINDDLATRDFTVNAMAADSRTWRGEAEAVIDPYGGLADLEAKQLRAVAPNIFQNDPVRLLRAVRFQAELGFQLDAATVALAIADASRITAAPGERVRYEFMRTLVASDPRLQLGRLDTLGLLGRIFPELEKTRGVTQHAPHVSDVFEHTLDAVAGSEELEHNRYRQIAGDEYGEQLAAHLAQPTSALYTRAEILRLVLLLHDIGKPSTRTVEHDGRIRFFQHERVGAELAEEVMRRLRFSNDEIALVRVIIAHHLRPILLAMDKVTDRAVHRYFRDTGAAGVDILVHAWCDQYATYGKPMPSEPERALALVSTRMLDGYYHAREQVVSPKPLINGSDVLAHLRIEPGPRVSKLLDAVREAQAAGEVTTREQALEFLAKNFDMPA